MHPSQVSYITQSKLGLVDGTKIEPLKGHCRKRQREYPTDEEDRTKRIKKMGQPVPFDALTAPPSGSSWLESLPPPAQNPVIEQCYECRSQDIVEDEMRGEQTCRSCGLVLRDNAIDYGEDIIDHLEDQGVSLARSSASGNPLLENENRTDMYPPSYPGLSQQRRSNQLPFLHTILDRTTTGPDKEMLLAMDEIDNLCILLNVRGAVPKRAKEIFKGYQNVRRKTSECGNASSTEWVPLRKEGRQEVVASAVFMSCRNERIIRTFKEVMYATGIEEKIVMRMTSTIAKELPGSSEDVSISQAEYTDYFCSLIDLTVDERKCAIRLAEKLSTSPQSRSRAPKTLSAVAIYYTVCRRRQGSSIPVQTISAATEVCSKTIKHFCRSLSQLLKELFP